MALKNFVGQSVANTLTTHNLDIPTGSNVADFVNLTISIKGGATAADFAVQILDDAVVRYEFWVESGVAAATAKTVWEMHPGEIIVRGDNGAGLQVKTGAAGGTCVVIVSAVYKCWEQGKLGRI